MTVNEIIAKVDSLEPNQYDTESKISWLNTLDGQIFEDVIRTHEPGENTPEEFTQYVSGEEELLVPFPYAENLYCSYIQARIAQENSEYSKYNAMTVAHNNAYLQYSAWYNRNNMPKQPDRGNRLRF